MRFARVDRAAADESPGRERRESRRLEDVQPGTQVPWFWAVPDLLAGRIREGKEAGRSREDHREPRALTARLRKTSSVRTSSTVGGSAGWRSKR